MKKKIILIIIILCFIATGCKTGRDYFNECREFASQKLKEKYGEEFVYDSADPNCLDIFCSPFRFYMKTTNPSSPVYKILNSCGTSYGYNFVKGVPSLIKLLGMIEKGEDNE